MAEEDFDFTTSEIETPPVNEANEANRSVASKHKQAPTSLKTPLKSVMKKQPTYAKPKKQVEIISDDEEEPYQQPYYQQPYQQPYQQAYQQPYYQQAYQQAYQQPRQRSKDFSKPVYQQPYYQQPYQQPSYQQPYQQPSM
jgi:hypothetical protein